MKKLLCVLMLGMVFGQAELTTKVYSISLNLTNSSEYHNIDLYSLTGYELDGAKIEIFKVHDFSLDGDWAVVELQSSGNGWANSEHWDEYMIECHSYGGCDMSMSNGGTGIESIFYNGNNTIRFACNDGFHGDISIAITAEFPQEDTGYIEDGIEFCLQTGANLLSFPCDNQIGVSESLPAGIENFITDIIGQGEATTYNPALGWVGNLDEFTPGSGYWFKSNSSLCFEYECVED